MRTLLTFSFAVLSLRAADAPLDRMFDVKLTTAQRNDACFELRGSADSTARNAMLHGLHLSFLRACAAENLRMAEAVEDLKTAAADQDPEIQAVAVRELGSFRKAELLPLLAAKAADPNLLIATNGLQALCFYDGAEVAAYLEPIARKGGIVGIQALNRLDALRAPSALAVARVLLKNGEVTDQVSAMKVLGTSGDASDLPALRELAARKQEFAVRQRGFGLMPAINISRAAEATIVEIEKRAAL
jgi:hypothetical protein